MARHRRDWPVDLEGTATRVTLRDSLRELPVEAIVPEGWRVGTEVVAFLDEPPADGATVSHPAYSRELLVTAAGTSGAVIAVYERDRTRGRRRRVASVPGRDGDRDTVRAAVEAAARHAARIESKGEVGAERR